MPNQISQYHLHKNDDSKLHFEIKDTLTHLAKNPQHVYKPHRHTYYQMIWFKEAGQHYVDYELHEYPANSIFLLNKGQVHYFCHHADNDGLLYHFDEIFLLKGNQSYNNRIQYKLFSEIGNPYLVMDQGTIDILEYTTPILQNEIAQKKYGYRELIFSMIQTLILNIERLKASSNRSIARLDNDLDIAMDFKKLIVTHMDEFPSLQQYADLLFISTKKLTSACKKYLHTTPANVISQRKVLEAKRLLSNQRISIKEVAFALGFDQPTYFTKYFKKHTGSTPKEFTAKM